MGQPPICQNLGGPAIICMYSKCTMDPKITGKPGNEVSVLQLELCLEEVSSAPQPSHPGQEFLPHHP